MAWLDLPIEELREHRTNVVPASDVREFWAQRLGSARALAQDPVLRPVDTQLAMLDVRDAEFSGSNGHRVRGWFLTPKEAQGDLPCLVQFIGYGGGRSLHHEWTLWPSAGWATLIMDTQNKIALRNTGVHTNFQTLTTSTTSLTMSRLN